MIFGINSYVDQLHLCTNFATANLIFAKLDSGIWKSESFWFVIKLINFREINSLVKTFIWRKNFSFSVRQFTKKIVKSTIQIISLVKMLLSPNVCQKRVWWVFRNFYTVKHNKSYWKLISRNIHKHYKLITLRLN